MLGSEQPLKKYILNVSFQPLPTPIPCCNISQFQSKLLTFSLVAQVVKKLPAMQETWVLSLGWEDPLEKGTATHSRMLAWRIPWTEEPGGLQSMGP